MKAPLIHLSRLFALWASLLPLLGQPVGLPDPNDPVAGMGVNIHFTDSQPAELEMLAKAGFHWVRMDFNWQGTERTRGGYDFSAYDRLLASLDRFQIRALLILDYTNKAYDDGKPSRTDAGRAAFGRWAAAAATHFKDRGVVWEIWNEPNGDWFWKPKPNADDYAKLALAANRAIHAAVPDAVVVGPALNGTHLGFLKVSAKAGVLADWSGITIHPYLRSGPEGYGEVYHQLRGLIEKYAPPGQKIDVICGESGYPTTWPGIDDATQGKYFARLFLFDVLSRVPLTIWYDWRDDGVDPKNKEHHFGIVHHDYHANAARCYDPKPAYDAAMTYSAELTGFRFNERIKTASMDDFVLCFTSRTSKCLVAWTVGNAPHEVEIPAAGGTYRVTSYDGKEETNVSASGGTISLTVDGGPRYLQLR